MGYVYTGRQTVNNTFRLDGHSPLDSRTVLNRISDVYINHGNKDACALYLNAYAGMLISAFDDDNNVILIALKDHTPYTKDNTTIDVTADNLETYWNVIGQFTEDKINNVIDPSINKLEDYVGSDGNITNRGNAGGITVTPTKDADSVGYSYGLSVNVDDDTIKLVNNALAVGQYKIEKAATATDGFLSSYILKYKAPGSSSWVDVSGGNLIDIPKDFVLKSVHICKASYNSGTGKYTETSTPSDAGWAADTNDVFFHFEWMTVDSDSTTTETFLKVADVIAADIVSINTSIGLLEDGIEDLNNHIDSSYVEMQTEVGGRLDDLHELIDSSIEELHEVINTSFGEMQSAIDSSYNDVLGKINELSGDVSSNLYFDGGTASDSLRMLSKHGNLEIKTIEQLESMTLSEIFKAILFELAIPNRTVTESLTVTWVSNSPYRNTVDVGYPFPDETQFTYTYTPEQWNWKASDGVTIGSPKSLSSDGGHIWKRSTTNNTSGTITENWSGETASFGTNGYFFVTVNRTAKDYATDSQGGTMDTNGIPYKAPVSGEKNTTGNFLSFTASYRLYSNANKVFTTASSAYAAKDTPPGTYTGDDTKTDTNVFVNANTTGTTTTTIYLQWPSERQHCYIYVPRTHKINSCNGAHPMTSNTFNIPFTFSVKDSNVTITNPSNHNVQFNKYELVSSGASGIATLAIVIGLA